MSGVEVVGLILGALPLVISAAEHYKKGFEPLVRWKRFKFVFRDFITSVDIQRQMFQLVLKKLLIRVQLEPEEKQMLLTTPDYEGWRRADIIEALKLRLGDSYDACIDILRAMNEDMVDLQDMMSLKDGTVDWANPGEKQWKYQAKRIQLSFSENGTRTVQALEKKIQDLKNLLELLDSTNDTLDGMKTISKDTTWGKLFETIRQHAVDLHSAIKNSWKCNCEATHQSGLQLQKRQPSDLSPRFTMSFALPPRDSAPQSLRRKVIIHAKESRHNSSLDRPSPVPIQKTYITQLRTNFETKSLPDVNVNTLPIRFGPQSSSFASPSFSFASIFTKSESNVTTTSSISIADETEILVDNHSKKWGAMRKSKPKKRLRFESDLPTASGDVERAKDFPTLPKEQNFPVLPPSLFVDNSGVNIKIDDLCSSLKGAVENTECLGYLSDDEHQQHEVRWVQESARESQGREEISLDKLLSSGGHLKLSRQKRYKIASIMASSLLQLQTTPWLSDNLEKKQILFYYQGSDVFVDEPYINHDFAAVTQTPRSSPTPRILPRKTLSGLGILLLELCFGEPIENQTELRKGHLSSDGKALEGTDYLTAIEWLDKVAEEEPKMAPVIKWCIFCLFEGKPNWADKTFMQAVYASVVQPLEMLVVSS
ncbi:hypothetical protein LHYA1_G006051 [Lachnellula hyalina]|uniref:DUF7580 domain-containing protein n=1 Tax=Lachnellula hyalina TaxID=1316788 RepID=A0A8H8TZN3_9HELO|nr:uncharacterized protein LHYA1_G006051 [Lachnellula hyalina]TVY25181.1 hypothetical protein LHYA1_G006051 [Lachnellula hyalina]